MPLPLSTEAYQQLWDNSPSQQIDPCDLIQDCPPELGQGQRRWVHLRQGILLLIHDYELRDHFWLGADEPRDDYPWLEFGFQLSGCCTSEKGSVRGANEHFVCVNGLSDTQTQRQAGQRTLQVDIHLTQPSLVLDFLNHRLNHLPYKIQQVFEAIAEVADTASIPDSLFGLYHAVCQQYVDLRLTITPAMQSALQQLLHCPHHSLTKQLYLESKSLELVALALQQWVDRLADSNRLPMSKLRHDDVERLYQARDILQQNLEHPPSLVALARQVGLNDYKLKSGFRRLFNTTVFGYLRDQRLQQAQQLLLEQHMSVTEVCNRVGYTSLSAFNAPFQRKFGCNPSACLKSHPILLSSRTSKRSVSSK